MLDFDIFDSSKKQGDVGLGSAISFFTMAGYTVCIPLTDSQFYDLVIGQENMLYKVQVKTSSEKEGKNYKVELRTRTTRNGKNLFLPFNNKYVDYLFVLTIENEKYLIPARNISSKTAITLGKKYTKYKV